MWVIDKFNFRALPVPQSPIICHINKVEDTFSYSGVPFGIFFVYCRVWQNFLNPTSLHAVFNPYTYANQKEKENVYELQG